MSNVYEKIGLKRVINAAGKMTALGVSTIHPKTADALVEAASAYVEIERLYEVAGKKMAQLINSPDACIVNSASAGLAMATAALICKDDVALAEVLPVHLPNITKREVILLKGQNVNYGAPVSTMIQLGGGIVVEVGFANKSTAMHVESAINQNTLAIYFIQSHHCVIKNMVTVDEVINIGKKFGVPVIVDAASESDLSLYIDKGADMAIYSGAKAICGPTSGLVACSNSDYARYLRNQYKGIGRAMKVGKESIMGLLKAVEVYLNGEIVTVVDRKELDDFALKLNGFKGLTCSISADAQGRPIYRVKVVVNQADFGISASELVSRLHKNDPMIAVRDHYANVGSVEIDPRGFNTKEEMWEIFEAINKIHGDVHG